MKTNWKYNLLFSFNVTYNAALNEDDFSLFPTLSCQQLLKKHNLIFKKVENGGIVLTENRINDDASTTPVWKIQELSSFTFILILNKSSLFPKISPYSDDPHAILPNFYGRKRHLYFDNLNSSKEIDQDLTDIVQSEMPDIEFKAMDISTTGTVSEQDLASLVPNNFFYKKGESINSINLQSLSPENAPPLSFNFNNQMRQAELDLTQSAYQFEQIGNTTTSEIIFAASELLTTPCFGIIQIYKDESIDYSTAIRYDINFEES